MTSNDERKRVSVSEFHHLTWKEARLKLLEVVEHHLETIQSQQEESNNNSSANSNNHKKTCFLDTFDLGIAFVAPVGLVVLAIVSHLKQYNGKVNTVADLVGSCLALLASLISIFVRRARRVASNCHWDVGVRRTLRLYCSAAQKNHGDGGATASEQHSSGGTTTDRIIDLSSGTTITDIYTVYRSDQWHHVPALLLVEGDVIAMQVGDTSPALVQEIVLLSSTATSSQHHPPDRKASFLANNKSSVLISAGEKIETKRNNNYKVNKVEDRIPTLPKGKLIRSPDSKDLLQLCNNMRIFVLKETPLQQFLLVDSVEKRSPQIHRQAMAIRNFLFILGITIFLLTFILLLVRPNILEDDGWAFLLPLPFLSILGVLPMTMPLQITFLEAIGTSRILSTVHPLTTSFSSSSSVSGTNNNNAITNYIVDGKLRECRGGRLFVRYFWEVLRSRLLPEEMPWTKRLLRHCQRDLLPVPPVRAYLLEKLGVATALCLIDDDLACEPYSMPQQLLIPSSHGLKLLDICPFFEDDSEIADSDDAANDFRQQQRKRTNSINSSLVSDSDSDSTTTAPHHLRTMRPTLRRKWRNAKKALHLSSTKQQQVRIVRSRSDVSDALVSEESKAETNPCKVQFEDPTWWQYLPSLKCIGLACLLSDGDIEADHRRRKSDSITSFESSSAAQQPQTALDSCVLSLVRHIGVFPQRPQLQSLAQCIGFSDKPNSHGSKGDLSVYTEANRFYVVSSRLLSKRLALDRHALGLEDARRWGYLNRDAVCIVIQDHRSNGYHLLTVGHPSVVAELCTDTWHGEKSTISPLSAIDRKAILDTSNNWCLSDLDVIAFSYAPVPYTLEQRIIGNTALAAMRHPNKLLGSTLPAVQEVPSYFTAYLVDNRSLADLDVPISKDSGCAEWSLVNNQIFLGMSGSLVSPREEIDYILGQLTTAGVRFVYFSPRNMRRTKELASQMGIDVAWNCAISLRSLDNGQEDPHRMISAYADWDVNARLPHGIIDVKRHLSEVDNVPLLVSLFTDATEETTTDMVNIFREYHDTVIAVGLSHLSSNQGPFGAADIAIGVDVLLPRNIKPSSADDLQNGELPILSRGKSSKRQISQAADIADPFLHYNEVEFVSLIASNNCVFSLKGPSSMEHLPSIIAVGRAALDASSSGALFVLNAGLSLAFLSLLCPCTVSTCVPYIPTLGAMIYLLILIPLIGLSMAWTDAQGDSMSEIPPKNDDTIVFGRDDGKRLYTHMVIRAFFPAMGSHFMYLIPLGELLLAFEPDYLKMNCPDVNLENANWTHVIRCPSLKFYSGKVRLWSGSLLLSQMAFCVIFASAGFVYRTRSLGEEPPWRNIVWLFTSSATLGATVLYLILSMDGGVASTQVARNLPYYYYIISVIFPLLWLFLGEFLKKIDRGYEKRACMLRRLQFETRLGMWSPK